MLYTQDYINGIEYKNSVLEAIYHSEGRVTNIDNTLKYEYALKDHLGNTRIMFCDRNNDGYITPNSTQESSEVTQENSYYAFGMNMEFGAWENTPSVTDNLKQYNGKELNTDFGLNWNSYEYRNYDAAICKFTTIDPLTEGKFSQTPYAYAANSPVVNIDYLGLSDEQPFKGAEVHAKRIVKDKQSEKAFNGLSDAWGDMAGGKPNEKVQNGSPNSNGSSGNSSNTCPNCPKTWEFAQLRYDGEYHVYDFENCTYSTSPLPANYYDNDGLRSPDFYTFNVSYSEFTLGWNINFTVDRHWQMYFSPVGFVHGVPRGLGGSATFNYLNQSNVPTSSETYNFLSGHGFGATGGIYGFVGNFNWSPTSSRTKTAFGLGIGSPQIGISYNYTPIIWNRK